ncbi:MAG: hypothetical protein GC192_13560 [Bacteroidetes bacterium]|nr:hypothetical protein [Bacteroidota bacterium]
MTQKSGWYDPDFGVPGPGISGEGTPKLGSGDSDFRVMDSADGVYPLGRRGFWGFSGKTAEYECGGLAAIENILYILLKITALRTNFRAMKKPLPMKKEPEKTLPELESKLSKLQSRIAELDKHFDGDLLEQELSIQRTKARLREQGVAEAELDRIPSPQKLRAVAEQVAETVALLKQVEIFNHKYQDFFEGEPTAEKLAEYVRDSRWMLPIFIKAFGEESAEVKQMREIAGIEVEGV